MKKPGSQAQSRVGRAGTLTDFVHMPPLLASRPLPGWDAHLVLSDLRFQEKPETQLFLRNGFFHHFQMLATDSKLLNHRRPNETHSRAKSSPWGCPFATSEQVDEGAWPPGAVSPAAACAWASQLSSGAGGPSPKGGEGACANEVGCKGFLCSTCFFPHPTLDSPPQPGRVWRT